MTLLFDTNIFIYHFNGKLSDLGTELLGKGLLGEGNYSIISKIEVLGFNQSETADLRARQLLERLAERPLTTEIAERTIEIRKQLKIKMPDAIIAATALVHSLRLVTRNAKDFSKVEGIDWIDPFR